MIVDELNTLFNLHNNPLARSIDLRWQINLHPAQAPDGRLTVVVQVIFSAASPLIGQRLWKITQPIEADHMFHPTAVESMINQIVTEFGVDRDRIIAGQ